MNAVWLAVIISGAATVAIKGLGPVMLGGRALPPRLASVLSLLAPALLAALIAIETFGSGRHLVIDARVVGVIVAIVAVWLKAPPLVVVVLAAATTALVRAL
jgi:branched-subunit amino acid transport protein